MALKFAVFLWVFAYGLIRGLPSARKTLLFFNISWTSAKWSSSPLSLYSTRYHHGLLIILEPGSVTLVECTWFGAVSLPCTDSFGLRWNSLNISTNFRKWVSAFPHMPNSSILTNLDQGYDSKVFAHCPAFHTEKASRQVFPGQSWLPSSIVNIGWYHHNNASIYIY